MKANAEQNCVESAKRGEPSAIAELYHRYWRAARATAYGVTWDLHLAEDAASQAFFVALDSLQELRDARRFGPWLRIIVVRTARRLKATKLKEKEVELQVLPEAQSPAPSAHLEQQELSALIHEAVANLSEALREALSLFYFEGYTIKEAALFLDVPVGTLKRRLHEGRQRLRDVAEQIVRGIKPMDPQREGVLQQLKDAANEGIDSESFYQAMRQAYRVRPIPRDALRKVVGRHLAEKLAKRPMSPERARMLREALGGIYRLSERARDPNHPVGAVASALRAALPEFQELQVDISQFDLSRMADRILGQKERTSSFLHPPGFAEESSGSYLYAQQAWLVEDADGSVCTAYELMQRKATRDTCTAQMKQGMRLSDAFQLVWKQSKAIELRTIEKRLRRLSEVIDSDTPAQFRSYEGPHYRAGLRMQLGDNPIPAAIGGVLNPCPRLSDKVSVACVLIYLEPWATAQSGQVVELSDFPFHDFMNDL